MAKHEVTPEIKAKMIKDCESLTGSVYKRAIALSAKYGFHRCTIQYIIRDLPCIDKVGSIITEKERIRIKELYDSCDLKYETHKLKYVSEIVNRSTHSVRNIIKASEPQKERMYSPITHPFF